VRASRALRTRLALALTLGIYSFGGCSGASERAAEAESRLDVAGFDTTVAKLIASGVGTPACNAEAQLGHRTLRVLTLTAEQCLTCESVGYVARTLAAKASAEGGGLVVTAPVNDTSEVCRYLRLEKVEARVIAFDEQEYPSANAGQTYLSLKLTPEGALDSTIAVRNIESLVDR
jgi:hypothetical protein